MTTPAAALCSHRWAGPLCVPPDQRPVLAAGVFHLCDRPTGHEDDMLLRQPQRCRCRCGATTTRPTEGER